MIKLRETERVRVEIKKRERERTIARETDKDTENQ